MKDLIYCQKEIPGDQCRYGFRTSADTGCGWIATYNALRLLGYRAEPDDLIRMYERMLPLVHGNAGTTMLAPALCFKKWGFPVEVSICREKYDDLVNSSDVCILFYRWRRKWKLGAHFVALHRREEGIVGYNTYTNSQGPDRYGESLDGWLRERKYFGSVLIGIRDKR
ncbi:MAG: hypothetical protein IJ960_06460 [Oscillospiraceae bacterium]|nr:hypothetical protein [Oscillospiraceae bacterium]